MQNTLLKSNKKITIFCRGSLKITAEYDSIPFERGMGNNHDHRDRICTKSIRSSILLLSQLFLYGRKSLVCCTVFSVS